MKAVALLGLAIVVAACSTPVGVTRVDVKTAHRERVQSALVSNKESEPSRQVLRRLGLEERFGREPEAVLATLHQGLAASGDEDRLFALAELSFLHAGKTGKRVYYLAAAVYAYALLFPGPGARADLGPADPRPLISYEIYNLSLAEALRGSDGEEVALKPGVYPLPFGSLDLSVDPRGLIWIGYRFEHLTPTATLDVRGLRNRYRRSGIGVAMAAKLAPQEAKASDAVARRIPVNLVVSVSGFLRIEDPRASLASGAMRGRLEIYAEDRRREVAVDGRTYPLEFDPTAALAFQLEDSPLWDTELQGFMKAGLVQSRIPRDRVTDGLFLIHPYSPGRIPVVFVHGTASSPARWAELFNELYGDRRIWDRYQFWFYAYDTGNPIGYSGGRLREALERAVRELDPQGTSTAIRQMVVIGHSQGGLLAKLTVIDSGNRFWNNLSDKPLNSLKLDPEVRAVLQQSLFFTPEPFIHRVIFMCTPHRGSYLAGFRIARLTEWFVTLPVVIPLNVLRQTAEAATGNEEQTLLRKLQKPPTSIDNMNPSNPFVRTLASIPVAPHVIVNSIIAVKDDGPPEGQNDGVVAYNSAHIDGVESELVVRSGHSVQGQPAAIEEVRRILLENAGIR